jgi:hypothetical protein
MHNYCVFVILSSSGVIVKQILAVYFSVKHRFCLWFFVEFIYQQPYDYFLNIDKYCPCLWAIYKTSDFVNTFSWPFHWLILFCGQRILSTNDVIVKQMLAEFSTAKPRFCWRFFVEFIYLQLREFFSKYRQAFFLSLSSLVNYS